MFVTSAARSAPSGRVRRVYVDERVLVLRLVEPRADRDILCRLHVQGDTRDRLQRLVQARDHLVSGGCSLTERLQRDEHGLIVLGDGRAAGARYSEESCSPPATGRTFQPEGSARRFGKSE